MIDSGASTDASLISLESAGDARAVANAASVVRNLSDGVQMARAALDSVAAVFARLRDVPESQRWTEVLGELLSLEQEIRRACDHTRRLEQEADVPAALRWLECAVPAADDAVAPALPSEVIAERGLSDVPQIPPDAVVLGREVGRGSFGVVHLGAVYGMEVALKTLF